MRWVGTTIEETWNALFPKPHLGPSKGGPRKLAAWVRIVISLIALAAGFYFISTGNEREKDFGIGIVMFVLGYWLR